MQILVVFHFPLIYFPMFFPSLSLPPSFLLCNVLICSSCSIFSLYFFFFSSPISKLQIFLTRLYKFLQGSEELLQTRMEHMVQYHLKLFTHSFLWLNYIWHTLVYYILHFPPPPISILKIFTFHLLLTNFVNYN